MLYIFPASSCVFIGSSLFLYNENVYMYTEGCAMVCQQRPVNDGLFFLSLGLQMVKTLPKNGTFLRLDHMGSLLKKQEC